MMATVAPTRRTTIGLWLLLVTIVLCTAQGADWPQVQSQVPADPATEGRARQILATLTLEQKVGQMTQAEIQHVTPDQVRQYGLGSVLNGGGSFPNKNKNSSVRDWLNLADALYDASMASGIPIIWGTDAVHGHNNVIGATIFPHNIGLGATRNARLLQHIGEATAREVVATGIDWNFAPTLAVVRNDRWGRAYEGYSEDPELVKKYAGYMIQGLQGAAGTQELLDGNHVVATAKHFIGDGGTENGIDQGDARISERDLRDLHGAGYLSALSAGVQTVMITFNSWNGEKLHGHQYMIQQVLKNQMGFDGLVLSDWNDISQVQGCTESSCAQAINAGIDMVMVPERWQDFIAHTVSQVRNGDIPESRIDDAVTRILRVKLRAGLFDKGRPSQRYGAHTFSIGHASHRAIARQAVRESLVLLKNNKDLLPLQRNLNVLVTGSAANDIGRQSGGWTVEWQGVTDSNHDFPGGQSIYDGILEATRRGGSQATLSADGNYNERPDVAIVVFGETPYAEGQGDRQDLDFDSGNDLDLMRKFKSQGIPVVSIFLSGRPMWVNPEINSSDAFVAAWLPGSEGGGVADVLFRKTNGWIHYDFEGRLSFSWPADPQQTQVNRFDGQEPLFPYGYGLSYSSSRHVPELPSDTAVVAAAPPSDNSGLTIFKSQPLAPFSMFVGDGANWRAPLHSTSGSSWDGVVAVENTDKDLQNDARRITIGAEGQAYFEADQPQDWRHLLNSDMVLSFDLRLDQPPEDSVTLRMGCGWPCRGEIDVTSALMEGGIGSWTTLLVDLKCFADNGADFGSIYAPWLLYTTARLQVSVANIAVAPRENRHVAVNCT